MMNVKVLPFELRWVAAVPELVLVLLVSFLSVPRSHTALSAAGSSYPHTACTYRGT